MFHSKKYILKQGYVAPRLKIYSRHHDLVDRYEISISQMTMDSFAFYVDVFFPLSLSRFLQDLIVYTSNTLGVIRSRNCLPFESTRVHPRLLGGVHVARLLSLVNLCVFTF